MRLREILETAIENDVSDIFIVSGLPISFHKNGVVSALNEDKLLPKDTELLLEDIYEKANNRNITSLQMRGDEWNSYPVLNFFILPYL